MKLSHMKVDSKVLDEGIWIDSEEFDGVSWRVRGTDTPGYQRALRNRLEEEAVKNPDSLNGVNLIAGMRITNALVVEYCLVDWRGIDNDEGEQVPYDPELAKEFGENDDYFKLARDITVAVRKVDDQMTEHREVASGN
jgi:hypothetical protein